MNKVLLLLACLAVTNCAGTGSGTDYSEYEQRPISGHPNYIEPATFEEYRVPADAYVLGAIKPWAAVLICAGIRDGDTIVLLSGGGYITAGNAIIQCLKGRDVTIAVSGAYSMATSVMLAGKRVCLFDDAPLGFHMPYTMVGGKVVPLTPEELEAVYVIERAQLRELGYPEPVIHYLEAFGELSSDADKLAMMPHGTMAGILGGRFAGRCVR